MAARSITRQQYPEHAMFALAVIQPRPDRRPPVLVRLMLAVLMGVVLGVAMGLGPTLAP
nr:hypothetical protein RVX_2407 [Nitratidesulfovibrio sp. HK-II]